MIKPGEKKFILVIGGTRSGKSDFALDLAGSMPGPRVYIATAEARDPEMRSRIELHRKERGRSFNTVEEPLHITDKVMMAPGGVAVIDCLTLWVSNLIESGLDDEGIINRAQGLSSACNEAPASVIAVSNEVGLGIVPENPLARRFRDLAGLVNQGIANMANEVYLVTAGIPLKIK